MPPKPKFTREEMVEAALELVARRGAEALTARELGAALGMVALFCGCTNSPLASICLAIEVFGGQCVSLFALACAVSYMLSSYFSLYREQHFLHSKLRIVGVQRVHGHWSETDAAHLTTNDDGEN